MLDSSLPSSRHAWQFTAALFKIEDPDVLLLKKARQEKKVKRYLEDNFQNREGKAFEDNLRNREGEAFEDNFRNREGKAFEDNFQNREGKALKDNFQNREGM
jgi:hypothetical protein